MTLNVSDSSALIRPNIQEGGPTDLTARRTDFLDFMRSQGRVRQWAGSSPRKWNLTYSGNASAELFVENQGLASPGKRTFAQASLSPWYARAVAAITGHLRDQIAKGGTFEDLLKGELADALKALFYLCETTLCGSAQDKGFSSIIDAADVYAGIDPASITLWASQETGSIGTLDVADMQDFYGNMIALARGADPSVILGNTNQMKNYGNIQGPSAGSGSIYRGELPSVSGQPFDIGVMRNGMGFNGIPITPIRTMANSELLWLDLVNDDPAILMIRDVETKQLGLRNDNEEYMVSVGMALHVPNRRVHGIMRGITP
jgi:hypothetical protein